MDESSRSTRTGKFVSKLRAEAQLASSGVVSSASRPPVHGSGSDSGLSSWSTSAAAGATDVTSAGLPARNKSGYVDNDNKITSNYITYQKIIFGHFLSHFGKKKFRRNISTRKTVFDRNSKHREES